MRNDHSQDNKTNVLFHVVDRLIRGGKQVVLELWSNLYIFPYVSLKESPQTNFLYRLNDCVESLALVLKGGLYGIVSNLLTILNSCFFFIVHLLLTILTAPVFVAGSVVMAVMNLAYFVSHSILIHLCLHTLILNAIPLVCFTPFALIDHRSFENAKQHMKGLYCGLYSTKNILTSLTSLYGIIVNTEHFSFVEENDQPYFLSQMQRKQTNPESSYTQIPVFAQLCYSYIQSEGQASWDYFSHIILNTLAATTELLCVATFTTAVSAKLASSIWICPIAITQYMLGQQNNHAELVPEIKTTWGN